MSRAVWAAALCGLVLRLGLWSRLSRDNAALLRADSSSYLIPAANLVEGHGFSGKLEPPFAPETFRTPGYPVFLALHRLAAPGERWPALTQAVLDAGTAVLAAACAAELGAGAYAWLAAAFYAVEPVAVAHSPLILSEPLFGFLLMLALYFLLRAGAEGRAGRALAAGFLLSLATLVRPITLYLWLPLGLSLLRPWRAAPGALLALLLGATLLPAAWCARNAKLFGRFSMSTVNGVNTLYYDGAAAQAAVDGKPYAEAAAALRARVDAENLENPFERSRREAALGTRILLSHPFTTLRLHAVSGVKMLLGPGSEMLAQELYGDEATTVEDRAGAMTGRGTRAVLARRKALWLFALLDALLFLLVYPLAARGAVRLWKRGGLPASSWLTPLLYLLALSTGGWAYYRFRVPLWPLLSALAAAAL